MPTSEIMITVKQDNDKSTLLVIANTPHHANIMCS
jgi:hypothetical protein